MQSFPLCVSSILPTSCGCEPLQISGPGKQEGREKERRGKRGKGEREESEPSVRVLTPRSTWREHRPPPLPAVRIPRGAASRGALQAAARTGRFSRRLQLSLLAGRLRRGRPGARRDRRARVRVLIPTPPRSGRSLPPLSRPDPAALPHRPPAPPRSALRMRGNAREGSAWPSAPCRPAAPPARSLLPTGREGQEGRQDRTEGQVGQDR